MSNVSSEAMPRVRFYEPGGTLSLNSPCYVVRRADEALLNALHAREYCYVLDSRQKGKSSLMVRSAKVLKDEGYRTVVLDLQGRGSNLTLEQWYAGMLMRFGDELENRQDLHAFWQKHQHLGPLERFFQAIEEVVLPTVETGLVIFVDEVDFVRSLPFRTDEFFAGIRHFYNLRARDERFEKLSFVLIGTADPVELIADPNLTPFNIGRRIELQDFEIDECGPLRRGLSEDLAIASTLMRRVIYWTSGHPYLTQRLCEAVATTNNANGKSDVDKVVSQIFLSDDAQVSEPNLHDVGRRVSDGVPVGVDPDTYVQRTREIYAKLLRGKPVPDESQDPVIASLKLSGLITADRGGLRIRTRIYRQVFGWHWLAKLGTKITGTSASAVTWSPIKVATHWFRGRPARYALYSLGGVLLLTAVAYRYTWSSGQPRFVIPDNSIKPGESVLLRGENLANVEATLSDDFGHMVSTPLQSRAQSGNADEYALPVPVSTPRGRYTLRLQRPPFLRIIPFGTSPSIASIRIDDERPLVFGGHNGLTTCAAYSPDGSKIVTSGGDSMTRVWDARNGELLLEVRRHRNWILSAAFSPDGKKIITASWDTTAVIIDAETGELIRELKGHSDRLLGAYFSSDGKRVVTCSWDRTARIWDPETGKVLVRFVGHTDRIVGVAFSPDGTKIATSSFDKTARVWDAKTGKQLHKLGVPYFKIFFVSFSPDGSRVITASEDSVARVWDVKTGKQVMELKGHHSWVVYAGYSNDGKLISTASDDKTAIIWDAKTGKEIHVLPEQKERVNTAYFSPDDKQVAVSCFDETVRLWDVATGKPVTRPVD